MSVYKNEKSLYLDKSINSMLEQTYLTNDFVIVCDGELTDELNAVINKYKEKFPNIFTIIRLEKNLGLGLALRHGIIFCKNELIARMDSDDISYNDRCEQQMNIFNTVSDVDIVGGCIDEFDGDVENIISTRHVPEHNTEIVKVSKIRNPFNHMSVMYKKQSVMKVGNYKDFFHVEDYFLWIRMLASGAVGFNIQRSLVCVRTGRDFYKRRGGILYLKSQIELLKYMKKTNYIGWGTCFFSIVMRIVQTLSPGFLREWLYINLYRKF